MSATSNTFWAATESIRDDLNEIASLGADMYSALEANDDPEEIASLLIFIQGKIGTVQTRIANTIPAMQDIAKAFDAMAAVKS
jgi:hypothetical protein